MNITGDVLQSAECAVTHILISCTSGKPKMKKMKKLRHFPKRNFPVTKLLQPHSADQIMEGQIKYREIISQRIKSNG